MNRCIDERIGVRILSYDLLAGDEKAEMDAHVAACTACRDLLQQTFGKQGALDDLAWRAFRAERPRVEPHLWVAERLRDLWLPFLLIGTAVGVLSVFVARQRAGGDSVGIVRLAVTRAALLESDRTQRIEPGIAAIVLRTDRPARAYAYEVHEGAFRRLLPADGAEPPDVDATSARELALPPPGDPAARVLLVLVPRDAPGGTREWDAAIQDHLDGGHGAVWPGDVRPVLRWVH